MDKLKLGISKVGTDKKQYMIQMTTNAVLNWDLKHMAALYATCIWNRREEVSHIEVVTYRKWNKQEHCCVITDSIYIILTHSVFA